MTSKKHKKVIITSNYTKHFLILASTITGGISFSAFASLLGIPIGNTSPAIGLKVSGSISKLLRNERRSTLK